jgi:hypothetical protein
MTKPTTTATRTIVFRRTPPGCAADADSPLETGFAVTVCVVGFSDFEASASNGAAIAENGAAC